MKQRVVSRVSDQILRRVYILFALFVIFATVIVLRVAALQLNRSEWQQEEMKEQIFFKKLVADRGNILSEDGEILATSLPFYKIALDPTVIDTSRWENFRDSLYVLSLNMALEFDEPDARDTLRVYHAVREALAKGDRHVYLTRKKLNFKQLETAKAWPILNRGRVEGGVVIEKFNNERFYPMGDLARITLGRLIDDTLAQRGIEFSFDANLKGRDGYVLAQKVVGDSWVPVNGFGEEASMDGLDIVTTIDVDIQDIVEQALKEGVEKNMAQFGTAILMEVATGEVKAIANYPEAYNYGIAMQVEPGSTFKTVSAAALFEDGLMGLCDTIDTGNGRIMYDDKEVTDNGLRLGKTDFEHIFAYSSNVGVSKAVNENYRDNPECYFDRLRAFGFYDVVNRQIDGEPVPQMIDPGNEAWTSTTLPSLSYGYSIRVTPLQMAAFYNGIANGGKMVRPYFVKEIRNNSQVIQAFQPEVLHEQMCSRETASKLSELLKSVVNYGSAASAFRGARFGVAGKTGTARKIEQGVGYVQKYRASFGGFFPADNPRYTLYIMVDEPAGGLTSGGTVAAPIFRNIADKVYLMDRQITKPQDAEKPGVQPSPRVARTQNAKIVFNELGIPASGIPDGEWVSARSNGHQVNFAEWATTEETIPNVTGMSARDAMALLEKMGFKVSVRGSGKVRSQSLSPGHKFRKGVPITLFLS